MRIEVDGQHFEVPDDATTDEIDSITRPQRQPGQLEAGIEGGLQGASLGFGDEMRGAGVAAIKKLLPQSLGGSSRPMAEEYRAERDRARAENAAGEKAFPKTYIGSQLAGGLVPTMLPGGATLPGAVAMGGIAGAGGSEAKTTGQLARDTGLGAGVGALGYGAGQALSKALSGLGRLAGSGARQAESRAVAKAADEVAGNIASARGSLGGEVQKGQRLVENLRRLGPPLSPEQQAMAQELEQRLTQSTLQSLPGQVGTIASKDAELAALKSGASQALKDRTADLLSTDEMKRQVLTRALRYGPVAIGSVAGHAIGGPFGGAVGALAGAGTRPMVRSVLRMAKNPAVQKAVYDAVENAAPATGQFLKRAIQAAALGPAQEAALAQ